MSVVVLCFVALVMVAAISEPYLVERQKRIQAGWPQVPGKGTNMRMVKHRLSGRNFPFTMYGSECAVQYTVAGKNYSVWTSFGSTFADPDPNLISDTMRSCLASRYVVRYKPQDASEAVADRID
jgi:hypothetical protein